MTWIDLHMHSCYSVDGEYTPEELMVRCRCADVRCASLADHNTVRGVKEALVAAEREGVELIPAVELDCTYREVDLHVLGYRINPDCAGFAAVEEDVRQQELGASQNRLARVRDLGLSVDDAEIRRLAPDGVISGEAIAEVALAQKENESHPLLAHYRPGGRRMIIPASIFIGISARGAGRLTSPFVTLTFLPRFALSVTREAFPYWRTPATTLEKTASCCATSYGRVSTDWRFTAATILPHKRLFIAILQRN